MIQYNLVQSCRIQYKGGQEGRGGEGKVEGGLIKTSFVTASQTSPEVTNVNL